MRGTMGMLAAALIAVAAVGAMVALFLGPSLLHIGSSSSDTQIQGSKDQVIAGMVKQIDTNELRDTIEVLQNFTTRASGTQENRDAASYLNERLSNITGLEVEYQGGAMRNIVATLPGNSGSSAVDVIGAHYDSINTKDGGPAPGATDDGCGVAIVLELARIMSNYSFDHTVKFALWNAEEKGGTPGSGAFVKEAKANGTNISSYFNFDSSCYDPDNRLILDVMSNDQSKSLADLLTSNNQLYGINFTLTYNKHDCESDHRAFWNAGYPAVMTHSETHGPAHGSKDTVDKVSFDYAKRNAELGLSAVATIAGAGPRTNGTA